MWNKVYLALLLISAVVAGFFAFYASSWLQSVGDPRIAWDGYRYHWTTGIYAFLLGTLLLIVCGNVVLWIRKTGWALWVSAAYFAVFAILFFVLLKGSANGFCLENHLCDDPSRAKGLLLAVLGSLVLIGAIYADQFILLRLHNKMYGVGAVEGDSEIENSRDQDPGS